MNHDRQQRPAPAAVLVRSGQGGVRLVGRVLLGSLLGLGGCIEFGVDPIDNTDPIVERTTITETFRQEALPAVDLLFVLDRTGSMGPELAALANSAIALGLQLEAADLSWQLGVVGSEMSTDRAGWLLGSPWIITTPADAGPHFDAIATEAVAQPEEAGIAAAIEALVEAEGGNNVGFRRSDASLHVIFVSDGDDESDPYLAGDPVDEMVARLALEAENGLPARASAVVGDGSCNDTTRGDRYIAVAEATGGDVVSICENTFAPIVSALSDGSIVLQDTFVLREQPASENFTVRVDDQAVGNWVYDAEANAVVFDVPPSANAVIAISYRVVVDPDANSDANSGKGA